MARRSLTTGARGKYPMYTLEAATRHAQLQADERAYRADPEAARAA